jgi:hypothetical protein
MFQFLKRAFTGPHPALKNIDRDAAVIAVSATAAAAFILKRRAALDAEGKAGQPLVVLLGERHSIPAHNILNMQVVKKLADSGQKIAVALEKPYNLMDLEFFETSSRMPGAYAAPESLKRRDKDGALSLAVFMGHAEFSMASHSETMFCRFLLRHGITTAFTDAKKEGGILDHEDPSVAQSLQECFGNAAAGVATEGREGIYARNNHMARKIRELAQASGARIIVQSCGAGHVLGMEGGPSGQSLAAQVREKGMAVLAVPVLVSRRATSKWIGKGGDLAENEKFPLSGLPEIEAVYDSETDKPVKGFPAEIECRADEAAYANGLAGRVGQAAEMMSVQDYQNNKESCKINFKQELTAWQHEKFASPGPSV